MLLKPSRLPRCARGRLSPFRYSVKPKAGAGAGVLTYSYRRYGDANHGMTPLYSLIDGVQYLFEPRSLVRQPTSTLGPGGEDRTSS